MNSATLRSNPVKVIIGVLVVITAVVHLSLGAPVMLLNALGYLTLVAAFLFPIPIISGWQKQIRWGLVLYTLLTIGLYFYFHADGSWQQDGLGIFTKLVEVVLILLLIYDAQSSSMEKLS